MRSMSLIQKIMVVGQMDQMDGQTISNILSVSQMEISGSDISYFVCLSRISAIKTDRPRAQF